MPKAEAVLAWTLEAWKDYVYWQGQDRKTMNRINRLLDDMLRSPFAGIGKPKPLREDGSGFWSRRIDDANRLVYAFEDGLVTIVGCRGHY